MKSISCNPFCFSKKMFRKGNYSYNPIVTSPTAGVPVSAPEGIHPMNMEQIPSSHRSILTVISEWWAVLAARLSDYTPIGSSNNYLDDSSRSLLPNARSVSVGITGILFSVGWWLFLDGVAIVLSANADGQGLPVVGAASGGIKVEDWICGLASTIGMVMVQMVSKDMLLGEGGGDFYSTGGGDDAWKARLWFFMAFVLMLGALGGSITVLIVKYTSRGYFDGVVYFPAVYVTQCGLILISALILWGIRNHERDPFDDL
jgi:hypothetical protein